MRRLYIGMKYKRKKDKFNLRRGKVEFFMKAFFLVCFAIYAFSILSISALVYGNVTGIVEVLFEKELLTPLAIVATLFALKKKTQEVNSFLTFMLLFIFSAYFVYIYSSFIEETDFLESWQRLLAEIGYVLNKLMFGVNFLCFLAMLTLMGFRQATR